MTGTFKYSRPFLTFKVNYQTTQLYIEKNPCLLWSKETSALPFVILAIGDSRRFFAEKFDISPGLDAPFPFSLQFSKLDPGSALLEANLHVGQDPDHVELECSQEMLARLHKTRYLKSQIQEAAYNIYCKVIAPFVHQIILFISHPTDYSPVLAFLAPLLQAAKADGFVSEYPSLLIYIHEASYQKWSNPFLPLGDRLLEELAQRDPGTTYLPADFEKLLRSFESFKFETSSSIRPKQLDINHNSRHRVLNSRHLQDLLDLVIAEYTRGSPFDFNIVRACRSIRPLPANLDMQIHSFISFTHKKNINQPKIIASALIMEARSSPIPYIGTASIFNALYGREISTRTRFPDLSALADSIKVYFMEGFAILDLDSTPLLPRNTFHDMINLKVCNMCIIRSANQSLQCSHTICEHCLRRNPPRGYQYAVKCCGIENACRARPPTTGRRNLYIQTECLHCTLNFLKALQEIIGLTDMRIINYFDGLTIEGIGGSLAMAFFSGLLTPQTYYKKAHEFRPPRIKDDIISLGTRIELEISPYLLRSRLGIPFSIVEGDKTIYSTHNREPDFQRGNIDLNVSFHGQCQKQSHKAPSMLSSLQNSLKWTADKVLNPGSGSDTLHDIINGRLSSIRLLPRGPERKLEPFKEVKKIMDERGRFWACLFYVELIEPQTYSPGTSIRVTIRSRLAPGHALQELLRRLLLEKYTLLYEEKPITRMVGFPVAAAVRPESRGEESPLECETPICTPEYIDNYTAKYKPFEKVIKINLPPSEDIAISLKSLYGKFPISNMPHKARSLAVAQYRNQPFGYLNYQYPVKPNTQEDSYFNLESMI